jgi:hypothetical protein
VALARFDAWLLPFINVYGLFGYVHNNSTTRGTVTVPALGLPVPDFRFLRQDNPGWLRRRRRCHASGWLPRALLHGRCELHPDGPWL